MKSDKHTNLGVAALVFGIVGILMILSLYLQVIIPYRFISIIINDPIYALFVLPFAILAIGFGIPARKRGDTYGTNGIILGVITLILTILFVTLFTIAYVTYGSF